MSRRWGIVPAAGLGTRIQPLAFSKELLPVGTRHDGQTERPRAVCEYLLERMISAGATHVCFVISPTKTDIMSYFGGRLDKAAICYAVQQTPAGLCDALFGALPFISPEDEVLVGLPDTIWFPVEGYTFLPDHGLTLLVVSGRPARTVRCCDHRRARLSAGNPGEAKWRQVAMGMGCLQTNRKASRIVIRLVATPRTLRPVSRNTRERIPCRRWRCAGRQTRRSIRGCRDLARLSRSSSLVVFPPCCIRRGGSLTADPTSVAGPNLPLVYFPKRTRSKYGR